MKRLLLAAVITLGFTIKAQQTGVPRTCGTPELPQQYETWLQSITPAKSKGKYGVNETQSVFNIPVIVHIIHNNEAVNSISATGGNNLNAAQVVDQINILNKDYNGTNTDTTSIPAVFKPLLGKFKVNFCLAVVNPTGGVLVEPGIDRINRVAKSWNNGPYSQTYIDATIKPNSIWDPNRYLNIWVCGLSNTLLGYATFPNPGTSGLQGMGTSFGTTTSDGVVILNTAFGSIGTGQFGQYNKGRTATHEVGHWIGLRHIWGDSNCGTDYCTDTPPAQNANYNCPSFPYKSGVCTGNTTGEMTMNYMDYTNDACMYMFTADQKNRAQLILTNSPMRAALVTSTACNLPAVGNDVGISYVTAPTYSQVFNCVTSINPVIYAKNYGTTNLTSAVFSFNVNGVNTQTFNWTGNVAPNTTFTVNLPAVNGLVAGAHVFSVNVSNPNGGADNNASNNNNAQNFTNAANFSFNAPSAAVCAGSTVVLSASGAGSYSWSTGAATSTISVNPSATTIYTVTGFNGACSNPKTVTVTVQTPPVISVNKTSVCENMSSVITASGASSYTWNTGETTAAVTVTLTSATIYTISASSSAGCATTQTFNILVNPMPAITISTLNVTCGSCTDATVTLVPTGGTAPYTYTWMPGNIHTPTLDNVGVGCYTVTIADALGCKNVDSTCVTFDTGIFDQELSDVSIKIIPNPTNGEFVMQLFGTGTKKIVITDALGRIVKQQETQSESAAINMSSYAAGIYYVKVISDHKFAVVKLIKE